MVSRIGLFGTESFGKTTGRQVRRVRKNDDFYRSCEHVSFFLNFDNKREMMSRLQKLLQELCWGIQHNQENIGLEEQCFYKLQAGILKFCIGLELFQHAFGSEELDVLRQKLFKHVKNMPEETNLVFQIEILESEIGRAIICLGNNKIHSRNLELLCLYLESLRDGDFTPPEKHKPGGMPMGK